MRAGGAGERFCARVAMRACTRVSPRAHVYECPWAPPVRSPIARAHVCRMIGMGGLSPRGRVSPCVPSPYSVSGASPCLQGGTRSDRAFRAVTGQRLAYPRSTHDTWTPGGLELSHGPLFHPCFLFPAPQIHPGDGRSASGVWFFGKTTFAARPGYPLENEGTKEGDARLTQGEFGNKGGRWKVCRIGGMMREHTYFLLLPRRS